MPISETDPIRKVVICWGSERFAGDSGVPIGTDENPTLISRFRFETIRCSRYPQGVSRPILKDT